jgi:hypothetical protein
VRLGGRDRALTDVAAGDLERRRALAAGRRVLPQRPGLLPPAPAVARAQFGEARRALRDLLAAGTPELVEDLAAAQPKHNRDPDERDDPGEHPEAPRPDGPLAFRGQATREPVRRAHDDRGPERDQHPEPGAVVDAIGVGLEVVRERRPRERPQRDERRDRRRDREGGERLESRAPDPDPAGRGERGNGDPRPRVGEHDRELGEVEDEDAGRPQRPGVFARGGEPESERDGGRGCKRQRVPVADRVAQARDAGAVREERRDHLAGERPEQHEAEQKREPGGDRPGRLRHLGCEQPEQREGEVDEDPVEGRPGEVGRDRPRHRQPDPARERREQRETCQPDPPRNRHGALDQHDDGDHGQGADPEEPPIRGAPAEEESDEEERARDGKGRRPGELRGLHRRPTLAQAPEGAFPYRRLTGGSPPIHVQARHSLRALPPEGTGTVQRTRTAGRRLDTCGLRFS